MQESKQKVINVILFLKKWQKIYQMCKVNKINIIISPQIIGRVFADPDLLPRSNDFGLNVEAFKELFCQDCPDPVLKLAVMCAQVNPENR